MAKNSGEERLTDMGFKKLTDEIIQADYIDDLFEDFDDNYIKKHDIIIVGEEVYINTDETKIGLMLDNI